MAGLWGYVPVQRCTVHKESNLLAHAPKHLHDEIKADFGDMMYAEDAETVRKKHKASSPSGGSGAEAWWTAWRKRENGCSPS